MERRKVDILCVQETRWKGSKARSIGAGFKLFYYGVDSKRNGVGVVLKEEFVRNVLEVKRVSDRVMSLKLEIEGVMLNVVSGYAPQVGCELEEKERFWSELDEVMESIPTGERVVIGADFNGHVGEGNTGDEDLMGKFGVKERNLEGQMVVDFAKRMDMAVVNTYFQKREEHRVTYKSGGRRTQVDYILCRRGNLKEISDCKVVVGESVAKQHRMVVCRMTLMVCKTKRSKIEIEKKTKWWKLKKEECCEEFIQKLRQALGGQVVLPDDWETTAEVIRETGRKVLGVSSGRRKEDKETWWWNEEVQDSIQRKRLAKKKWDMDMTEENRQEYKELQRRVKREVSKAKQKAYDKLYTRLDTREGQKNLYTLARQRDRDGKDVQQVRVIKDRDGRVLTSEESVQRRWKEYFEELMNEENEREKRVDGVNSVEQKVDKIRKDEVRKALKRMKSGKAVGPDDIPVEVWKCLGEAAVEFLTSLFNRVLESERMPEEWRRSVLVPIFKNKGDVQSCSNYRGIKLMSHTMKLWERVVEARLRKVVEICEQQYGFMPRKSTTDAIFALRILMEKYRDGQRELHCVFVDLEKAYDRVPREELWYCMRKSGVAEKYVRVVQDMYERSRTVVRCAVGQTEEFNVQVGLHQGSALSPFLFAIVMDQLSEEVRQESPWTMMFADDIVICSQSREQVEENLERWRFALERRGMKVSRSKTEYMCVNGREGSGTVRLQGEEVKKVQEFKYLGSTVQSNGECGKEVTKRVQAGWNGWRKVSGVLCDQKISARIKGKVYRTVVRPAMLYGLETVSLRKRQESELEVAELKMLRFSLGVTRLDRIRNEYIRGTAHVGRLGDKVREARLRWFGHVQRRESITVISHMGVEVPQYNYGVPSRSTFQHPSQGLQEGQVLHTAVRPISQNNSEIPILDLKAHRNNTLVYQGKLQHMEAELGGYKQAQPSPPPLTMGHSRVEEGPTSLKELGSRAQAVHRVNLSKHGAALSDAYNEVVEGKTATDWALFTYEGNSNDIQIAAKGGGGLDEMVQELSAGKVMYAFCRVTDPHSRVPKFILINWTGEGVTGVRRGVCANHLYTMASFLRGAHVTINAHSEDDVEPELIMNKVSQAVGVNYSLYTESNRFKNTEASHPVGSVYHRTSASQEIKETERENFWAQMEKEEQTRRQQERKKAEEERQRLEKKRREQEEREAAERQRRQRERAKQIDQLRLLEKRQESQLQNQQRQEPVEQELQAAQWKGIKSSRSVQEANGLKYCKTSALEEMNSTDRENFWAQLEKEEQTRRQQERKKAEEERQRLEKERKEQEEREAAERERRQRERAKQIDQLRLLEKRQESQLQNQQRQEPVEQELQAAQWKGIKSSRSVQEANGLKYCKTSALEEINGTDRENFWAQLEKEEQTRRQQERKKAEEERQRLEKERKEQEEREAAERERRQRERAKQIDQLRLLEKRQESQLQNQQRQEPVEQELQAAQWKGIKSSRSVQEANGLKSCKTSALEEINGTDRENFWAQLEKEEQTRRQQERKKAEEERQRLEKERIEQEERETAERERQQRERAKQINQLRLLEKRQESQLQNQQRQEPVEQELQAAQWKGIKSSRSVQEANGLKSCKTSALEEINGTDRENFWAQLETDMSLLPNFLTVPGPVIHRTQAHANSQLCTEGPPDSRRELGPSDTMSSGNP
ncbi:hypothetical protein QTP70_009026 [Hemibagrus guttatus]|uniref:ribonuclease H n=1 Tax=Hemibagrus guttatus TaxID=175788 RepID=A0AAE0QGK5_9TELE|nr:hypothetical protein QTP70_009026 [Hemibagrus guttatus]